MKKEFLLIIVLFPSIVFGQTIGAYISPTEFREFMPHNLGADTSLPPLIPSQGIHGAKYQWGYKPLDPNVSDSRYYTQADDQSNNSNLPGWSVASISNSSWSDITKNALDPCPVGFRVPTQIQWQGVLENNNITYIGTWDTAPTNYSSGVFLGNSLFLPAAGKRIYGGELESRGSIGGYWSSSVNDPSEYRHLSFHQNSLKISNSSHFLGYSIRCISENSATLAAQDIQINKDNGFNLYPNPASTEFFIKEKGNSKKRLRQIKIEIYDLAGKLHKQQEGEQNISVRNLSNGIYIVKLTASDGTVQTEKIIVEK